MIKTVLFPKLKLNTIKVLISLIDSYISHDEFVLVNNVLKEYKIKNKKFKDFNNSSKILIYLKKCYCIV